jgi:glycosyltransferase involved in cell wall biosynthesis
VDLMLQALRGLPDNAWRLIRDVRVCGGGILDAAVRAEISVLRAAGRPVQAGSYLDKQGAADLLESSDFLLLPSRIESIPVIFSDALQAGCPLVMTPVGDLPRLASEQPVGVMARTVSAEAFAQAMREALAVGPARFASGLGRARVQFDLGTTARNFMEIISGRAARMIAP